MNTSIVLNPPVLDWIRQQRAINTDKNDLLPDIAVDTDGNSYVTYMTFGTVSGQTSSSEYDIVVFKMNVAGQLLWIRQQPIFNTISNES